MENKMMEDFVTVEKITEWLTAQVQAKNPLGPDVWCDAAAKINVLLQEEQEKQFLMEQDVAKLRGLLLDAGETVAKARTRIEATDEYRKARNQKAKVERALELIRIAKIQSRMASGMLNGQ